MWIRGVQKNAKVRYKLTDKLIPFLWGIIRSTQDISVFGMHIYFNMGVKRSVRASGMQPTIFDILHNCVKGQKRKYPVSVFFFCIFQNCIFLGSRGSSSRPPRNLKFSVILIIPHRNGISLSANSYLPFAFFGPP